MQELRQELSLIVLALVVVGLEKQQQGSQLERVREQLSPLFIPVELRIYRFEELQRKYGVVK
jgi:hypothetical protein